MRGISQLYECFLLSSLGSPAATTSFSFSYAKAPQGTTTTRAPPAFVVPSNQVGNYELAHTGTQGGNASRFGTANRQRFVLDVSSNSAEVCLLECNGVS